MNKIKDKALKQCKLYAECALLHPELKHLFYEKVWAFSDIGILSFDEATKAIDRIIDNALTGERRKKDNACY